MERAQIELDKFVKNLLATITYIELTVDPKYYKHIIGKNGTNSKSNILFTSLFNESTL